MSADRLPLGILTTDARLVVRTWDAWLSAATGITSEQALNRSIGSVVPEIAARGHLALFDNVLAHGTVEVLATAFHHYLIPCPPSEPSATFDRMQQHVTIGPLREDGRIVGVIVTIEDVTSRREHERAMAREIREQSAGMDPSSPGPAVPSQHIDALTRLLGQDDWRVRRTAVATLAGQGQAVVDAFVRTLREQHHNFGVLSSALDLLAVSDIDVNDALVSFLDDEDVNLRTQSALILGERRDRRAIPGLIAHLSDPDVNVQFHVIEALGRLKAVEATDTLTAIAERGDFFLAFPAIQALTGFGTASVAARLVPLLADEMLRTPVIEALGAFGDEDVSVPLVQLLNTSDAPADVIAEALAALDDRYVSRYGEQEHIATLVRRTITATGTQTILDAVRRVGAERLPGLARMLGWLEGEAVQRALTRLLGQDAVRSQVVEALVRHGSGVVDLLVDQLRAEDLDTRQAAAVALGRIGDRRATTALIAALADPELVVPVSGALARIGDGAAFDSLMALLSAPEPVVRQSVIAALNSIGHAAMPGRIAALLASPDPIARESSLSIAGYFGYPECLEQMLACARDEAESVRRIAVENLALFEDPRVFACLTEALARDTSPVRSAAAAALSRIEHPGATGALVGALGDRDMWVRYAVVRALAAIGDTRTAPAVIATLQQDAAPPVRLAALDAIGRLKPSDALDILEPLMRSDNDDIARAAMRAAGHVDRPEALPLLEPFLRADQHWRRLTAIEAMTPRTEPRVAEVLQWVAAVDDQPEICSAAVDALARIGRRETPQGAEATRALLALTAEPRCRETTIAALSNLPRRRIGDIATGLQHPAVDVRRATVEALSRMKQPDASRVVETALDDVVPSVRLTAVAELKHLGARTSHKKLMSLARTDPDDEVRQAAMMAVARAGSGASLSPHDVR